MSSRGIFASHECSRPARRPGLTDSYLKTTRAKEHLDSLRTEIRAFLASKPYSFRGEDDTANGLYRLYIDIADTPDRISLILGDLLYCLRSSLDQLVWALAKLNRSYPQGTQFPILGSWDTKSQERFKQYTSGVPADAIHIIDSLQPHHRADAAAVKSHLLWQLNLMCNIDKHRRIPVYGNCTEFHLPQASTAIAAVSSFQDNCISVPSAFKSQMKLDPKVSFDITFGDLSADISCDFAGIERIHNFVCDDVLPRFSRFFQ